MLKLLHAADLHLDTPLKGLLETRGVPERAARCTLDAFTRVIDLALRERVDGVLLAGDLFDRADRSLRARLHLVRQLERLAEAGVPAFLVAGNHDPLEPDAPLLLPPNAHVFGASWSELVVARPGGTYRVQGLSHAQPEVSENLARAFHRVGPEPSIGLLHCNVGGQTTHRNYAPCTLGDLAAAELDYWALGHVHTQRAFAVGRGLAAYPGNPQGRHAGETGPRGCLLVELDPSGRVPPSARFLATDVVRWHWLEVGLEGVESIEALVRELEARVAAEALAAASAHAHVFRLTLSGRTALHREMGRPGARAALEERLGEALAERGCLLESVELASSADWALDEVAAAGGLPAEVARWLASPVSQSELDELWREAGLEALDRQLTLARADPLDPRGVLSAAARRALDLLLEAGP